MQSTPACDSLLDTISVLVDLAGQSLGSLIRVNAHTSNSVVWIQDPFCFLCFWSLLTQHAKKTNPKNHHVVFKSLEDPAIRSLGVGEAELE